MPEEDAPGQTKACFDDIYDSPDPRAYFRTLGALDYEIPQLAQPAVTSVMATLRDEAGRSPAPLRVLDVCCSYGVNAALLRTDVTLAQMYDRYSSEVLATLTPTEVAEQDARLFAGRRTATAWVAGLDVAQNAIDYACRVGLLDQGWAEDLEAADPSPGLADELARVDLIITTGGVAISPTGPSTGCSDPSATAGARGCWPWCCACSRTTTSQRRSTSTASRPRSSRESPSRNGDSPAWRSGTPRSEASSPEVWTRPAWRPMAATTPSSTSPGPLTTLTGFRCTRCSTALREAGFVRRTRRDGRPSARAGRHCGVFPVRWVAGTSSRRCTTTPRGWLRASHIDLADGAPAAGACPGFCGTVGPADTLNQAPVQQAPEPRSPWSLGKKVKASWHDLTP